MKARAPLSRALAKLTPSKNGSWSLCVFMWSYFTILWNLMSRSDSVSTLMEEHFDWEGDAMKIQEQGHKADQQGKEKYWKHVYANPAEPIICPVLALAVHVFSMASHSVNVNHKLFDGTNNKDRFGRNLAGVLSKCNSLHAHIYYVYFNVFLMNFYFFMYKQTNSLTNRCIKWAAMQRNLISEPTVFGKGQDLSASVKLLGRILLQSHCAWATASVK